jgi:dTMP kinase
LAYQGAAGGLNVAAIESTGRAATDDLKPDLTVIFDVDGATAAKRIGDEKDRMEQKGADYHARVREGFLAQAAASPDRMVVIDAKHSIDDVFVMLCDQVRKRLG